MFLQFHHRLCELMSMIAVIIALQRVDILIGKKSFY